MQLIQSSIFLIFLLGRAVSAYKVTFYSDNKCGSQALGDWVGGKDQGCRQDFVGQASGAVVESTGNVDDNLQVQFYSSSDCSPGTETSETEDACTAISGNSELQGETSLSFQVVDRIIAPPLRSVIAPAPSGTIDALVMAAILANPSLTAALPIDVGALETAMASVSLTDASPTAAARRDARPIEGASIELLSNRTGTSASIHANIPRRSKQKLPEQAWAYHGMITSIDGIEYKLHQIFDEGFVGVRLHEWDDEKHVQDPRGIEHIAVAAGLPHDLHKRGFSLGSPSISSVHLEERGLQAVCDMVNTCKTVAKDLRVSIGKTTSTGLSKAATFCTSIGKPVFDFLNDQPFISQTIAGAAGGLTSGLTVWAIQMHGDKAALETCQKQLANSEEQTQLLRDVVSLLKAHLTGTEESINLLAAEVSALAVKNLQTVRVAETMFVTNTEAATASALSVEVSELDAADRGFGGTVNVVGCDQPVQGELCSMATGFCATATVPQLLRG